jgi:hypothetical protein
LYREKAAEFFEKYEEHNDKVYVGTCHHPKFYSMAYVRTLRIVTPHSWKIIAYAIRICLVRGPEAGE